MADDALKKFGNLDREALMERMAAELPDIRESLQVSLTELSDKTGMDEGRLRAAENGKRKLKWSEYMTILFVLWNNDIGRGLLESRGLFPQELKEAMSVNRNAHAPVTESKKYGF